MKNKVLKIITAITTILFLVSICALDSASATPIIVSVICLAWILLFVLANREGR